jgi:hypothetical protein
MHIFYFFFFIILPTLVFERLPGESVFTITDMIGRYTAANFFILCFFYVNYYFFIPKLYFEKKYFIYVLCVIGFLCLTFPLPHLIVDWLGRGHGPIPYGFPGPGRFFPMPGPDFPPGGGYPRMPGPAHMRPRSYIPVFSFTVDELRHHLYLFFTAFFLSFLLRTRKHLSQVTEDKLNAELSSLKAQINPHFLFNTLNTIYALSMKNDNKAGDAILHLSGLMRYVTKDVNEYIIPLQKELDYITNYIELQKARLGSTAKIYFDVSGAVGDKKITPLILITYIENAFKYGVNPDVADCIVWVQIDMTDTQIVLRVFNKKVPYTNRNESTGIGMTNTRERLRYLYPQKHTLEVVETEKDYSVILTLELK